MPREFCLFLDENHCNNKHVLDLLIETQPPERHSAHFAPGTVDAEWLPFVGMRGWALLTTDKRIQYRILEREAVKSSGVATFYFSRNNMSGRELAGALRKAVPAMCRMFVDREPPYFAAITSAGEVHPRPGL